MPNRIPTALVVLSGVLFVTTVAAIVALTIAGHETAAVESLAKPLLTGVILTGVVGAVSKHQGDRLDEQDKALDQITHQTDQITHQTNGVLDKRIREQTKNALRELAEEERQGRLSSDG